MENIGGFFQKFQSRVAGQVQNLTFIIDAIKKHTGVEVDMKNISISAGIVRLKISGVEKNEIFLKKERILKEINAKTKSLVVKDLN